jgi:hypothetical protein
MIRIAITPSAYDAITATLPFGSVDYEAALSLAYAMAPILS